MALKPLPLIVSLIFFTTTCLCSSPPLPTSTISAAPAFLPESPLPSPTTAPAHSPPDIPSSPSLSPDITPLFPTPGQAGPSPSVMPTIPSSLSPPNPDATAELGLNPASSPGPSAALAPASAAPLDLAGVAVMLVTTFLFLQVLVQN